jgi:hypothetical protein
MDGFAIVPPVDGEGYVELSKSAKGKLYEKHILTYGDLHYPGLKGGKVKIDDDFADKLIANFDSKVVPYVQVPLAGTNNEHSEAPDRNIGQVVGLSKRDGKIYAKIDARKHEDDFGKTLLGASAYMHLDYTDNSTQKKVGPTLIHVAVTNHPFINKLEEFSELNELVAASADGRSDAVILTAETKENQMPTKDELIAALSNEHGIDVVALQEKATEADKAIELSNSLKDKIEEQLGATGLIKLSNGQTASADDLIGAVADAGSQIVALSTKVDELVKDGEAKAATSRVEALISKGRILPKDKEAQVELLLSNEALFEKLLPEKSIVKLSNAPEEIGFEPTDESHGATIEAEILRLSQTDAAKQYINTPASA